MNAPATGASEHKRPTRRTSLDHSPLGDLGERQVGHSREKVEADRRNQPRRRFMIAITLVTLGIGLPLLYMASSGKKQTAPSPIASNTPTGAPTEPSEIPTALAAQADSTTNDTFPTIQFDTTAGTGSLPATTTLAPAGPNGSATAPTALTPDPDPRASRHTALPSAPRTTGSEDWATGRVDDNPPLLPPSNGSGSSVGGTRTSGYGAPSLAARMATGQSGFASLQSSSSGAGTPARRVSPLAAARTATEGGTDPSASGTAGQGAAPTVTPGIRTVATAMVNVPSAASGEPLAVELAEALVDRGREVLPAGTRGYGKGTAWDDGTGTPRLDITFTLWVLPSGTVRQLAGRAYSLDDDRPGLPVPFSRQVARKGQNIAANFGAAVAIGKIAERILPPANSSDEALARAFTPPPQQQALQDVWQATQRELNLTRPPVAILLHLRAGTPMAVVFGMP